MTGLVREVSSKVIIFEFLTWNNIPNFVTDLYIIYTTVFYVLY